MGVLTLRQVQGVGTQQRFSADFRTTGAPVVTQQRPASEMLVPRPLPPNVVPTGTDTRTPGFVKR